MQQTCITGISTAAILCRWPRRTRLTRPPEREHACLFPPSVMRRQTRRQVRQVRYVQAGTVVTRMFSETVEARTHQGYDRDGGNRWSLRAVHRELDTTRYMDDYKVRKFVAMNPDGASLDEIAVAMNLSKEGVAGCERRAIRKLLILALEDEEVFRWATETLGLTQEYAQAYMEARVA